MTKEIQDLKLQSQDQPTDLSVRLSSFSARSQYSRRLAQQFEARKLSKLKSRVTWPDDLAELAGGKNEHFLRLSTAFQLLAHRFRDDELSLAAVQSRPPHAISRLMAETLVKAPSTAADLVDQMAPPDGEERRPGEAYLQWILLDGLEKGIEMTVPLDTAAKRLTVIVHTASVPAAGIEVRVQISDRGYVRGVTGADGKCVLGIPGRGVQAFVSVSARPARDYWSAWDGIVLAGHGPELEVELELQPLRPNLETYLDQVLGTSQMNHGTGVTIGVVDSGWVDHVSLPNYRAGTCTVSDDPFPNDVTDTIGHGSMVAGIIGGQGDGKTTVRGIAPGVKMIAYRALPHNQIKTDDVPISKAIRQAVEAGCDIINISIGGLEEMPATEAEIEHAWQNGVVCIVAAGNLNRQQVLYPARYKDAIAVSAMGCKGSYPGLSLFSLCETSDSGSDAAHYLPDFTNIGSEVAFCAPGVGIVSTFLGNSLHSSKGTSFAAPIVAGLLARLLSLQPAVTTLKMVRTAARSASMKSLLETSPLLFGFAIAQSEGNGCPRP